MTVMLEFHRNSRALIFWEVVLYGESAKSISRTSTHSLLSSATQRFVLGHPCLRAFTALTIFGCLANL